VVGDRGLKDGQVEYQARTDAEAKQVPLDAIFDLIRQQLGK
jgi:prolyl-tRNA synthetase